MSEPSEEPEAAPADSEDADTLDIPLLAPVPLRILALLENQEFQMQAFAEVVRLDDEIAHQIISLASSPLYGASQKFEDVKRAVVYLGLRTALTICLGFSLFKVMRRGQGSFEEQWCWRRLLINAVAARELAKLTGAASTDQAFLGGLLQDFGLLLLIQQRRHQYEGILAQIRRVPEPLADFEHRTLGYTHAIVSEALMREWKFSPDIVDAVARHHDPGLGPIGRLQFRELLVLAENVSDFFLQPAPSTFLTLEANFRHLPWDSPDDMTPFLETIADGVFSLADILQVRYPRGLRVEQMIQAVRQQIDEAQAGDTSGASAPE